MTFDDYSKQASTTAKFGGGPKDRLAYLGVALWGESGEFANKLKKVWRVRDVPTHADAEVLLDELGDVLWYLDRMVAELGSSLDKVAAANLVKLAKRYAPKEAE